MVAHRSRRRPAGAAALVVAACLLAGICSGAAAIALPKAPHAARHLPSTHAARRRAAARDAATLLSRVRLPADAVPLAREPDNDQGSLAEPATLPVNGHVLVDKHGWWKVTGTPDTVLAFLQANVPLGAKQTESGSMGPAHGKPTLVYVGYSWPPVHGLLAQRVLLVQAAELTGGGTGIRADALVQWIVPRSASERVPRGVHEVDVTRAAPGQSPSLSIKVVAQDKIRALISMVDALGIVQPVAVSCPLLPVDAATVTFTFRASDGGTVLATASELASAREPTTACDPMTFIIRGRPQTPLLGGAAVLRRAGRLLGVHLQTASHGPAQPASVFQPGQH
jgi:hypothetical protein